MSYVNNLCNVDYDEKYIGRESSEAGSSVKEVMFYIQREQVVAAGKVTLSGPLFEVPFEIKCTWWRTYRIVCFKIEQLISYSWNQPPPPCFFNA